ncbi:MAG: RsiV family protein [Bacteroidota bacterium]
MKKMTLRQFIILGVLGGVGLACQALAAHPATPAPTATPTLTATATLTPSVTPTVTPTETPVPLSRQVTLVSVHSEESGKSPNYTITSDTPEMQGSDDPRVQEFNSLAGGVVSDAVNEFKASLKYAPATPVTSGSSLDVKYDLVSPPGDLYSLKFNVAGYFDGAAHPYHYSRTLTYDLEKGQEIKLAALFLPDSDYLKVIADFCKAELATRDIGFDAFSTGADPTDENYRNWNITAGGLLITFDEYQVAPYAAGPQTVLIPYSELTAIINPEGPLVRFSP